MPATDQRKGVGHIKFFKGATDAITPKTNGNKHKRLRKLDS
jgi:hypothetical protein